MSKEKFDEIVSTIKAGELFKKKEEIEAVEEKKCTNTIKWVLIIVGAVTVIAGIAYAVYRYLTPDYLEDFEDDFDDDFEDDDDDDKEEKKED